eukprot:GHRR01019688.1.p2 GENE.GHRR01019688.1~~GHRR01019688.1.p2  ORF type:complete len:127 (+),score=20.75 GHRR01019688.1:1385-1765(+)
MAYSTLEQATHLCSTSTNLDFNFNLNKNYTACMRFSVCSRKAEAEAYWLTYATSVLPVQHHAKMQTALPICDALSASTSLHPLLAPGWPYICHRSYLSVHVGPILLQPTVLLSSTTSKLSHVDDGM